MRNLPNAKAYELQTWYTDGIRRPVSSTSAMTSKIKSQVKVARSRHLPDRCLAHKSRFENETFQKHNCLEGNCPPHNAHQFQGQRPKVTTSTNALRPEVHMSSERKGLRTSNFFLLMENEDLYHQQAPWPPRSKVRVAMSHGASDRCWPISRGRKVPEILKLVGMLPNILRAILRTCFRVKWSKVKVSRDQGDQKVYHI